MKRSVRLWILYLTIPFYPINVTGQQQHVNTTKIELLITQWNDVHNSRNIPVFENILNDELLFYTEHISREKATLLKKLLFVRNPDYQQRIASGIKYTFHTNGILKCEFLKEVWADSDWKPYPMYLLVGYKKHGYWILGESDHQTDQRRGFVLKVGEPENAKIVPASMIGKTNTPSRSDIIESNDNLPLIRDVFTGLNPLYFILVLLSAGVLLIVNDQLRQRISQMNIDTMVEEFSPPEQPEMVAHSDGKVTEQAYQMVEYHLKQIYFKEYVLKIFDPLSFTYTLVQSNELRIEPAAMNHINPIIDFQFHDNLHPVFNFTVQCIYREDNGNEIKLFPAEQLILEKPEPGVGLYYVIGIGGSPTSPDELYLVPSLNVDGEKITRESLLPFKKTGMFYFRRDTGSIV